MTLGLLIGIWGVVLLALPVLLFHYWRESRRDCKTAYVDRDLKRWSDAQPRPIDLTDVDWDWTLR